MRQQTSVKNFILFSVVLLVEISNGGSEEYLCCKAVQFHKVEPPVENLIETRHTGRVGLFNLCYRPAAVSYIPIVVRQNSFFSPPCSLWWYKVFYVKK